MAKKQKKMFNQFKGRTISNIQGMTKDSDEILISFEEGGSIMFHHEQDCCESVLVEQVDGLVDRHIGAKFMHIIEKTSENDPNLNNIDYDSVTWTFYTMKTSKGYIDFRWVGESNGYYSESVDYFTKE